MTSFSQPGLPQSSIFPRILSWDEQCCYTSKCDPLKRVDHQEWLVNVGDVYSRKEISALFYSDNRMPLIREAYPNVAGMYCIASDFTQLLDTPNVWRVFADWSTPTNIQDTVADPTKRPIIIRTGTYREQRTPNVDFDEKPVTTTAGEPILHTIQRSYPTYTCIKFLKSYPTKIAKDRDFVNSDSVVIYGVTYKPWELFCPEITISELLTQNTYQYFEFEATIYVNTDKDGWKTKLRNAGYHERRIVGWIRNPAIPAGPGNNVFQLPLKLPVYAFEAIQMGVKGKPTYPSSPVLLDEDGRAFREKKAGDPIDGPFTGPVIGLTVGSQPAAGTGITKEQWDKAVVELRFTNPVSFNQFFPLR